MKILILSPHPDDTEFAIGGFLSLINKEVHVKVVCITDGRMWPPKLKNVIKKREQEQKIVANKMSYEVEFLGFKDTKTVECLDEIYKSIKKIIIQNKPDLIFCNWKDDFHTDHKNTSWIIQKLSQKMKLNNIVMWEEYSSLSFKPNVYIDISTVANKKKRTLSLYKTQLDKIKEYEPLKMNKMRGKEVKVNFAEALYCSQKSIKKISQIINAKYVMKKEK